MRKAFVAAHGNDSDDDIFIEFAYVWYVEKIRITQAYSCLFEFGLTIEPGDASQYLR